NATRTGSVRHWATWVSTALEQASPTASLTSSMSDSDTPLRRATAVATSRAVRTWAGNGVKGTSNLGILPCLGAPARSLLLRLPVPDGLVDGVVDAEDLRQPGDAEDLQYPLLRADQVQ